MLPAAVKDHTGQPRRVPLPPLNFGALRSGDFVESGGPWSVSGCNEGCLKLIVDDDKVRRNGADTAVEQRLLWSRSMIVLEARTL